MADCHLGGDRLLRGSPLRCARCVSQPFDMLVVVLLENSSLPADLTETGTESSVNAVVPDFDWASTNVTSKEFDWGGDLALGMAPAEGEQSRRVGIHYHYRNDIGSRRGIVAPDKLAVRRRLTGSRSVSAFHHSRMCSGLLITSKTTSGEASTWNSRSMAPVLHGSFFLRTVGCTSR